MHVCLGTEVYYNCFLVIVADVNNFLNELIYKEFMICIIVKPDKCNKACIFFILISKLCVKLRLFGVDIHIFNC